MPQVAVEPQSFEVDPQAGCPNRASPASTESPRAAKTVPSPARRPHRTPRPKARRTRAPDSPLVVPQHAGRKRQVIAPARRSRHRAVSLCRHFMKHADESLHEPVEAVSGADALGQNCPDRRPFLGGSPQQRFQLIGDTRRGKVFAP
jgi:hypothetical protein